MEQPESGKNTVRRWKLNISRSPRKWVRIESGCVILQANKMDKIQLLGADDEILTDEEW